MKRMSALRRAERNKVHLDAEVHQINSNKGIGTSLADLFEVPRELLTGAPKVTITGRRQALIENHRGISKLGSQVIEIAGQGLSLRLEGEGLKLLSMSRSDMIVGGQFHSIVFM